jgi:23S rRNA (pseudouridine1915-N3)-methyltransferase
MVFHVVAVGRMRDGGIRAACADYTKRLRPYLRIEVHEVPDVRRASDAEAAKKEEAQALLRRVPPRARQVVITRSGSLGDSRRFAERLEQWREDAKDVAFVIGGAHGLHRELLDGADERLSLSPLTFPHDIARLLLLEQLYRGSTILRGMPYHKGD